MTLTGKNILSLSMLGIPSSMGCMCCACEHIPEVAPPQTTPSRSFYGMHLLLVLVIHFESCLAGCSAIVSNPFEEFFIVVLFYCFSALLIRQGCLFVFLFLLV